MNDRSWFLASLLFLVAAACGTDGGPSVGGPSDVAASEPAPGANGPPASSPATAEALPACASLAKLEAWQSELDRFDGGFRPTGSPAHEGYVALLRSELASLGVSDVHTEPYSFDKWTPSSWSFALEGVPAFPLSGYVPYSGRTGASGVTARVVYVAKEQLSLSPATVAAALASPSTTTQSLTSALRTSLMALSGALFGKIVVFEMPAAALSPQQLFGTTVYLNDPDGTLALGGPIARPDLSAMLLTNAVLGALATSGAAGAVGILDLPEEAARGLYAPFFGTTAPNLPAVYVDRATGQKLRASVEASILPPQATLVLEATVSTVTSDNLVGVIPGRSDAEIVVGSHTDGPNSLEDNGPVALLALAACQAGQPAPAKTIRLVLSGGHFVGSRGILTYAAAHSAELAAHARAAIEIEHLGAREWAEGPNGVMRLTGRPEMELIGATADEKLIGASIAFSSKFPRSVVTTPPVLGEGPNLRPLPLVQILSIPAYLLVAHEPAITTSFTDYALMQRQIAAFFDMERTFSDQL